MFGIIILLKTITICKSIPGKWEEYFVQNLVDVKLLLHYTSEDQNRSRTSLRNASPNIDLEGMFAPRFRLAWSTLLSETDLPMPFEPDGTFVGEDDVFKIFSFFQAFLSESKAGDSIRLSNHLTITGATFLPTKFSSCSFDCGC